MGATVADDDDGEATLNLCLGFVLLVVVGGGSGEDDGSLFPWLAMSASCSHSVCN